ncbi:MAG: amidohydrolase family protein, partial [Terriglobia bacterium]
MKAEKTAVMAGKEATRSGDRPILVAGGLVVDPVNGRDGVSDVLIEGGRVARVAKDIKVDNAVNVDATDKVVTPGLIDMHVHLREPGREDEETIETGSLAAAAGGFATVVCMPNTDPPVDHASVVELIIDKARERGRVNIRVV